MNKYLITGGSGFVAKYMCLCIQDNDPGSIIILISRSKSNILLKQIKVIEYNFDLIDFELLKSVLSTEHPNYIIHLASQSSVASSWINPQLSYSNNTNIFLNILEAVRTTDLKCRILSVGSSEEYGVVDLNSIPLIEESKLNPSNPYAVARVSQEMLSKVYCKGYDFDIVMTRSFNHIGPGQSNRFVVSSFINQIIEISKGLQEPLLKVGDLSIIRDFLDVRDVVEAYFILLEKGISSEVYNVCSGNGISLFDLIHLIKSQINIDFEISVADDKIRPIDNPIIIGSNYKLKSSTSWSQKIILEKSIVDIISSN